MARPRSRARRASKQSERKVAPAPLKAKPKSVEPSTRIEKDSMGTVEVPAKAYYGVQTMRAVQNFPISGLRLPPRFIRAQGLIKAAAAVANRKGRALKPDKFRAIRKAALEVAKGRWNREFVVDVFQAGAGTSQNMNANEVIANRALEILRKPRGDYAFLSPNDEVNRGQSTNDTIPTAIAVAAREGIERDLLPVLAKLERTLDAKARRWRKVVKSGRTHLADATPITLGQEFSAYAQFLREAQRRLRNASEALSYLPLGGSAVGTGINTVPRYQENAIAEIGRLTGLEFHPMPNTFAGIQNIESALEASAALRGLATALIKIADDVRLLGSGPRSGLFEILLPAVQPGSSIMPGKVNPVMAEMLDMVGYQVIGNDTTIANAVRSAQLELNVMMPVAAYSLLQSIQILATATRAFHERCVKGLEPNVERCREYANRSLMLVTALTPRIGYLKAAEVAKEAHETNRTLKEVLLEKKLLTARECDQLLDPMKMTVPGTITGGGGG